MSSVLSDKILSLLKSNLDNVTGGSWTVYYAPDIPERIYDCAKTHFNCRESEEDILAVVDTTLFGKCDEGLAFSAAAMHYKDGYNKPEEFSYRMIENMRIIPHWYGDELEIDYRIIRSTFYKKSALKSLLEQILAAVAAQAEAEADKLFNDVFGDRDLDNANLMLKELEKMSENIGKLKAAFERAQAELEEALAGSKSPEAEENILNKVHEALADEQ